MKCPKKLWMKLELYEKLTEGKFDINGKWTPRMDNFTNGYPKVNYSEYIIDTNGKFTYISY